MPLGDFARRAEQRFELDRPACFDILQHRRLERAQPRGDGHPVLAAFADRATDRGAHRGQLGHAFEHPRPAFSVGQNLVGGRSGQRRQRIDRRIAPQLVPDRPADIARQVGLQAGAVQQGEQATRHARSSRLRARR